MGSTVITGKTVFEWDEFKTFKERLGIETDIFDLCVKLECGFCAMITYSDMTCDKKGICKNVVEQACGRTISEAIFQWPEFLELAERLGVDMSKHTTALMIDLDIDNVVSIQHDYMATITSA